MRCLGKCLLLVIVNCVSSAVQDGDVKFYLTNNVVSQSEIRTAEAARANVESNKDVKILIHGWVGNINNTWYANTRSEYLRRGGSNVIEVDWSRHANGLYSTAVSNVDGVGYQVALMILALSDTYGIPLSRFHLIGHSLGAHIAGYAGQHIRRLRGQVVGRITGLDPAGPSYEGQPADSRLSSDDATFVDVIHTDGGGLGYRGSIGHVDYFPNGGTSRQNGCGLLEIACSHNRAPAYFYESINGNNFGAVACDNLNNFNSGSCSGNQRISMGENVDRSARGNFYLNTASSSPFGLGL